MAAGAPGHAPLRLARQLAAGVPAVLLAGALIGQHGFGLYPCEMCLWQRYPHYAAIGLGLAGYAVPGTARILVALAAIAIAGSGMIGGFHAGVEYGWWQGVTDCAGVPAGGASAMDAVMNAPMVRCDAAPWDLFGISLAGWNFILSLTAAIAIALLLWKDRAR
jgi:disulfide bond formation protein DsbB